KRRNRRQAGGSRVRLGLLLFLFRLAEPDTPQIGERFRNLPAAKGEVPDLDEQSPAKEDGDSPLGADVEQQIAARIRPIREKAGGGRNAVDAQRLRPPGMFLQHRQALPNGGFGRGGREELRFFLCSDGYV